MILPNKFVQDIKYKMSPITIIPI